MANVLNRSSGIYLESVNTPDYPEEEWLINPDLSAVANVPRQYWVINLDDSVREMTDSEKLAYDQAHPPVVIVNKLNNGMPAYMYTPAGIPVSVEKADVVFSSSTGSGGAKNFYLACQDIDSTDNGFLIPRNAVVKSISASFKTSLAADVTFKFRETGTTTDLFEIVVPAGQRSAVFDQLAHLLNGGLLLSCYMSSTKNVGNPRVTCELSWRN